MIRLVAVELFRYHRLNSSGIHDILEPLTFQMVSLLSRNCLFRFAFVLTTYLQCRKCNMSTLYNQIFFYHPIKGALLHSSVCVVFAPLSTFSNRSLPTEKPQSYLNRLTFMLLLGR
uniref:Uncharacterized protein n=1 Tax=Rhipicephalus microplus TaxID=6941 RepID=A0A6G5AGC4_RHIMP